MREYKVIVKIQGEVINLTARNKNEALLKAMDVIAQDYTEDLAESCDYEIQQVKA